VEESHIPYCIVDTYYALKFFINDFSAPVEKEKKQMIGNIY
jgi:hypothetical protein